MTLNYPASCDKVHVRCESTDIPYNLRLLKKHGYHRGVECLNRHCPGYKPLPIKSLSDASLQAPYDYPHRKVFLTNITVIASVSFSIGTAVMCLRRRQVGHASLVTELQAPE